MYVNDKMKLNRFQAVKIPAPREYFQQFGGKTSPDSMYDPNPSAYAGRKLDQIDEAVRAEDYQMYKEYMEALAKAEFPEETKPTE